MFNNQPNQGGGLFGGGGLQSPQNSGGLFGGNQIQNNQNQGSLFNGQAQNKVQTFGTTGGLFGGGVTQNTQGATGTGLFGGQTQQQQGGGLFGGTPAQQPQQGLFGQPQTQQNSLFGSGLNPQPQQQGGMLNQQNSTQTAGMFGQTPTQSQGGLYNANQTQQTGMFSKQPQNGGGLFPAQQQQGGGLFGQQPQQTGLFGGQQQPPATQGLFGGQQQTVQTPLGQTGGLFGAQQQNKSTGIFGGATQTGGILPATTTQSSLFPSTATSAWGNQQQPATSTFGQAQGFGQTTPGFGTNTNQLGGTSWGVNTSFIQPVLPQQQQQIPNQPPVTPVKSKNPKVDNKHSIKCISALEQYNGMSKQEIRCYYLLNGGNVPTVTTTTHGFGQQNTGWNKPNTTQATTSFTALGAPQANQTGQLFGQAKPKGTGLFGGNTQPVTTAFGGSQPQQQTSSLFGGQTTQLQGSLFGNQPQQQQQQQQQPQQPQGSLFGQTNLFGAPQTAAQQTGSLFGQFSTPQQQQQTGSLFGGQQPQQGGSLFGQKTQQGGSLFGQTTPAQQAGSLFGGQTNTQPATGGGLFGGNTSGGLFSATTPAPATAGGLFSGQSAPQSLFGAINQPQQSVPYGTSNQQNFSQINPYDSNLSMLTSFPLQSSILSNELILDPNYNQNSNNMLSIVLNALVSGGAISKKDADKLLKPSPFDELVKNRQKQLERQKQQQQIFTNVPSIFQDPINFKQFDISDDFFQMRRSSGYWQKQKQREQSDRRKFNVAYVPTKRNKSTLNALREQTDDVQRAVKKLRDVQKHELPVFDDTIYKLKPSMIRISMMSVQDCKNIHDVQISDKYGKIHFLEPVSLYMKDIQDCVDIKQDTIDIKDSEWQTKKCELTFYNFGGYLTKEQKDQAKIRAKMMKWIKKNQQDNMKLVSFDLQDGTLIVSIN